MAEEIKKEVLYSVKIEGNDQFLSQMADLRKANQLLREENKGLNTDVAEQAKQYERNTAQIKQNSKELNQLTKEVTANGTAAKGLRGELTEMRKRLQEMAAAGQTGTKEFKELRNQAAALQDNIDRVNKEIKTFADDAVVLNTIVDSTKGLTAGMQLYHSVTALAGVENEQLMQVLTKLTAIQGVANSLQQVSNMLQKESRVVLLAKIGATKVATTAQWAWNAAMSANPIALIVAGVAALIAGIVALVKNFDTVVGWFKRTKDVTEELTVNTRDYAKEVEALQAQQEKAVGQSKMEIELLKAKGASIDEIRAKERALIQQEISNAKARIELKMQEATMLMRANAAMARAAGITEERIRQYYEEAEGLTLLEHRLQVFDAQETVRLNERVRKNKEASDKISEQDEKRLMDLEQREQLAAARLEALRDGSLQSLLELAETEYQQRISKQEFTQSELELMWFEHRMNLMTIEQDYNAKFRQEAEDTATVAVEAADTIIEAEKLKASAVAESVGGAISAWNKGSKAQQRIAIFQKAVALAETIFSISRGTALNASAAPFPLNIPLIAGFAAQVGGLIGAIQSTKVPKAAKGMIIRGKSHAAGGEPVHVGGKLMAEIEGNEYLAVVNKYDAPRAAMLDAINRRHGKPLSPRNYLASGGLIMPQPRQDFEGVDMELMLERVISKFAAIPVVVAERDITDTQARVVQVNARGDLVSS
jgi:hypothetical protein